MMERLLRCSGEGQLRKPQPKNSERQCGESADANTATSGASTNETNAPEKGGARNEDAKTHDNTYEDHCAHAWIHTIECHERKPCNREVERNRHENEKRCNDETDGSGALHDKNVREDRGRKPVRCIAH